MIDLNKETTEIRAIRKYTRMSPHKVRRVLDQIRGQDCRKAIMILEFMPYKSCEPILQTLKSAISNAEHNSGIDISTLYVSQAYADKGPVMKRFRPRAQGRAYSILKPTCHITIHVAQAK